MELLIVGLVVGAAAAYVGAKVFNLFRRAGKAGGCSSCGTGGRAKTGCENCPLMKR